MSFAHVSDLHVGLNGSVDRAAADLCDALLEQQPAMVLCTGDVTHAGRRGELEKFREIFAPLLRTGRMLVVPGNHDRLGDGIEQDLMPGERVQAGAQGGSWVVRLDSSGPHNRRWIDSHGLVTPDDVDAVEAALRVAPAGMQTILMLHHHPLPLPHDSMVERLVTLVGWPSARELAAGSSLLERIRGLCDVVLHGHRHVPAELSPWPADARPLRIFSAGSSTLRRSFRLFRSAREAACWLPVPAQPALAGDWLPA